MLKDSSKNYLTKAWARIRPHLPDARWLLALGVWLVLGWVVVLRDGRIPHAFAQDGAGFRHEWSNTDFTKRSIDLNEVLAGGPPKDGIPAIDKPKFVSVQKAQAWLRPRDPLLVVDHKGVAKGYPLQILIWHEIVNDHVAGLPVAVTFCPLCNSALVFDRRIKNNTLTMAVTGLLRNSDMIMWDRQTESWWQQLTGKGIVGHYNNATLTMLPSPSVSFAFFAKHYPKGLILSKNTGFERPYGKNPYVGYDSPTNTQPFLLKSAPDSRLHPVERVLAVEVGTKARVYAYRLLRKNRLVNDVLNAQPLVIFFQAEVASALDKARIASSKDVGTALAHAANLNGKTLTFHTKSGKMGLWYDEQTRSTWNFLGKSIAGPLKGHQLQPLRYGTHFAFAWLVFRPKSSVYTP